MVSHQHRLSVALCTYNGGGFLYQQLKSIAEQSRLPDEVVACDDGSTDGTVALLREFAASVSFPVRIIENAQNLGVTANFAQAIGLCTGDLIALSDQDDIWYPNRLSRCEEEFNLDARVDLIFSDANLIDEQGRETAQTLWQRLGF